MQHCYKKKLVGRCRRTFRFSPDQVILAAFRAHTKQPSIGSVSYPRSRITRFFIATRTKNVSIRGPTLQFHPLAKHRCGSQKYKERSNALFESHFCAGCRNRTGDKSLENSYFATKLIPQWAHPSRLKAERQQAQLLQYPNNDIMVVWPISLNPMTFVAFILQN